MSGTAAPVTIVSVDSHGGPPAEHYREYLDPDYRSWMDELLVEEEQYLAACTKIGSFSAAQLEVIDADSASPQRLTGAWDLDRRLAEMDREGIAAEIFLQGHQCAGSPFFAFQNRPYPPDVRLAGVRAYHRWLADVVDAAGGRLIGVAETTTHPDLDALIGELHWAAGRGFKAAMFPCGP